LPYASHQSIRIHYQIDGDGPALVLHHGLAGSLEVWRQLGYAAALRDNYKVIMLDARGHGASDKPHDRRAYGLLNQVADVLAVLDALQLAKAHFLGYSMGGWIGLGLAKYAPERVESLVLGGTHPYADQSYVDAFGPLDGGGPEAFLAALERVLGEPIPREVRPRLLANDLRALTAAAAQPRPSLEDVLPTMVMPCLLFVGEADGRRAAVEKCARQIAHAALVTIPGGGHVATLVRSDVVLPHVMRFLAAQRESDRGATEVR
jgi:pimeloyl-ACP methyl ester carboxylesterase